MIIMSKYNRFMESRINKNKTDDFKLTFAEMMKTLPECL